MKIINNEEITNEEGKNHVKIQSELLSYAEIDEDYQKSYKIYYDFINKLKYLEDRDINNNKICKN